MTCYLCHINQIIERKKTLITDIFPIHIAAWKKWLFQEKGKYWSIISVASSQNQFHLYNGYFIHVWTCFLPHIFILYLSTWDVVKIKLFFLTIKPLSLFLVSLFFNTLMRSAVFVSLVYGTYNMNLKASVCVCVCVCGGGVENKLLNKDYNYSTELHACWMHFYTKHQN